MSGGIFGGQYRGGECAVGSLWVESREASKHPAMGDRPCFPLTKNDPVQTVIVLGWVNPALEFKHLFLSLKIFFGLFFGEIVFSVGIFMPSNSGLGI